MLDQRTQDRIVESVSANVWSMEIAFTNQVEAYFHELRRPSTMYRPTLTQDGDKFIALLGPNLQEGVVGVGETPQKAMLDFDRAFCAPAVAAIGAKES